MLEAKVKFGLQLHFLRSKDEPSFSMRKKVRVQLTFEVRSIGLPNQNGPKIVITPSFLRETQTKLEFKAPLHKGTQASLCFDSIFACFRRILKITTQELSKMAFHS